jgi:recombination protein RecT
MANDKIVSTTDGLKTVLAALKAREKMLRACLPKHLTPERWFGVVSRSIQNNPKLLQCTGKSLMACIFQSAQLGLECDGVTKESYLIPYKVRGTLVCQLIPGYPGYLKLVRNSGQLLNMATAAVWEKDVFDFEYGTNAFLRHKPNPERPSRDEVPSAYWCKVDLLGGGNQFEVMFPWQIYEIRDKSPAYRYAISEKRSDTPWIEHLPEQGRKTVLIRVCKMLPKSTEMLRAIRMEEQAETGEEQDFDFTDITAEEIGGDDEPIPQGSTAGSGGSKLDQLTDSARTKSGTTQPAPASSAQQQQQGPATVKSEKYADSEASPFTTGELSKDKLPLA